MAKIRNYLAGLLCLVSAGVLAGCDVEWNNGPMQLVPLRYPPIPPEVVLERKVTRYHLDVYMPDFFRPGIDSEASLYEKCPGREIDGTLGLDICRAVEEKYETGENKGNARLHFE